MSQGVEFLMLIWKIYRNFNTTIHKVCAIN